MGQGQAPGERRRVVIVGAGQAGGATAAGLRELGFAGEITLLGEEALAPYERPPLSKDILIGRMTPEQTSMYPPETWREKAVTLELGARAISIARDARTVALSDGRRIAYDYLVLATGVRPRRLTVPGGENERVHYLRTHVDAERLKAALSPGVRVAIIGAGFIGLEVAASARKLAAEVAVYEAADRPLARLLPRAFAEWMTRLHEGYAVPVSCARKLEAIQLAVDGLVLRFADGGAAQADLVVVGIGAAPNAELAENSGLVCRDGVVVDLDGRTSDPAVFAVGDVARFADPLSRREWRLESWRNAFTSAMRAANAIVGAPTPPEEAPWFWTDQYDRNIQIAGAPDDGLALIARGELGGGPYIGFYVEDDVIRGAIAVDAGRDMRVTRDLIAKQKQIDLDRLADPSVRLNQI